MSLRRQLTLFVTGETTAILERIRSEFNPAQFAIIQSHVTLCREDELENFEKVVENLSAIMLPGICINFGPAERFAGGKGVQIPGMGDNASFHALRAAVLQGIVKEPQKLVPHITLIHPRNATCTDAQFAHIQLLDLPRQLCFSRISLIEQENNGKWQILQEANLQKDFG